MPIVTIGLQPVSYTHLDVYKRQVYPVIEGTRDDQPELDFSHDDPDAGLASPPTPARKTARPAVRKGKTAELFPNCLLYTSRCV